MYICMSRFIISSTDSLRDGSNGLLAATVQQGAPLHCSGYSRISVALQLASSAVRLMKPIGSRFNRDGERHGLFEAVLRGNLAESC